MPILCSAVTWRENCDSTFSSALLARLSLSVLLVQANSHNTRPSFGHVPTRMLQQQSSSSLQRAVGCFPPRPALSVASFVSYASTVVGGGGAAAAVIIALILFVSRK